MDSTFRTNFGLYGSKPVLPQPIHIAAYFNLWKPSSSFLSTANLDVRDATGSTALHIAAGRGYSSIVEELIKQNASKSLEDANGSYPLHRAVRRGNYEIVSLLLNPSTDLEIINKPDKYKFTSVHVACQLGWRRCLAVLLDHKASLLNDSGASETPVGLAIENGHIAIVRMLLNHDQSLKDHCCKPLIHAARRGLTEMIKFLCEVKVDITYEDPLGQTALHKACICGSNDLVEYLLNTGRISVDAPDKSQRTPLYFAAERGHIDIVHRLLQHGANKNSLDRRGETPLFKPAGNGHIKVVDLLLKAGTDATILDLWDRTPLRFAAMKGQKEIVRMLLERTETEQDIPDWSGCTVLHNAAAWLREGQEEIIDILFEYQAKPESRDHDGRTALQIAVLREED